MRKMGVHAFSQSGSCDCEFIIQNTRTEPQNILMKMVLLNYRKGHIKIKYLSNLTNYSKLKTLNVKKYIFSKYLDNSYLFIKSFVIKANI